MKKVMKIIIPAFAIFACFAVMLAYAPLSRAQDAAILDAVTPAEPVPDANMPPMPAAQESIDINTMPSAENADGSFGPLQPNEQPGLVRASQPDPKPNIEFTRGEINPIEIPSLLFTYWEHTAIIDARRSRGMVRPPTEDELTESLKQGDDVDRPKPPPEEREVSLSGISYMSANEWTIWINGQRVTPDALPVEAMDLKVYEQYVEIKWFDEYSNQILPIRLRPHQRFNMDTRIFLPGIF
jgi:hypothetical protein